MAYRVENPPNISPIDLTWVVDQLKRLTGQEPPPWFGQWRMGQRIHNQKIVDAINQLQGVVDIVEQEAGQKVAPDQVSNYQLFPNVYTTEITEEGQTEIELPYAYRSGLLMAVIVDRRHQYPDADYTEVVDADGSRRRIRFIAPRFTEGLPIGSKILVWYFRA